MSRWFWEKIYGYDLGYCTETNRLFLVGPNGRECRISGEELVAHGSRLRIDPAPATTPTVQRRPLPTRGSSGFLGWGGVVLIADSRQSAGQPTAAAPVRVSGMRLKVCAPDGHVKDKS